jgi:hypothetical protein
MWLVIGATTSSTKTLSMVTFTIKTLTITVKKLLRVVMLCVIILIVLAPVNCLFGRCDMWTNKVKAPFKRE